MAILLPLVVPLTVSLGGAAGFSDGGEYTILLGTISSVLAGSVFGDHCSPISDTTVMSSMATACDHVDHVRTQMPYALVCGALAVFAGYLPTVGWAAWSPALGLLSGTALILLILFVHGRRVPDHVP
jgi:Na+/H+ antiporter NhaC